MTLPVLISTHEPFVTYFLSPARLWRGMSKVAFVGAWHLASINPQHLGFTQNLVRAQEGTKGVGFDDVPPNKATYLI